MINDPTKWIDYTPIKDAINESQRLFHGRGQCYENLGHISIDWFPPVILITLYRETDSEWLLQVAKKQQQNIPQCSSVQVQYRHKNNAPFETLLGEQINYIVAEENSLKYNVQLGRSQNTGLFLDMRNGREWVENHAKNKRVLNLFSYTCAFSVAALAGGAKHVVNVDNNKAVLSKGRENHKLNQQDLRQVTFEKVNIFTSYSRLKKHGPYDLMICDPPSYQVGSVDIRRDYKKIISRIPQFMNPGSLIMLCLNSPSLGPDFLMETVNEHCPECQFVEAIKPPTVFKDKTPERGLKTLIFRFEP